MAQRGFEVKLAQPNLPDFAVSSSASMSSTPSAGLGRLGEYTVIRSLGEGTFGKVKRTLCSVFMWKQSVIGQAHIESLRYLPSRHTHSVWTTCRLEIHSERQDKSHEGVSNPPSTSSCSSLTLAVRKVRTRIVREIDYLKQLKHPHIIKLYMRSTL